MNDLISIITPSYNTAQYIGKTIETVQAQTYTNWEMIIVDDCSSDNTDDVVKDYLSDPRIRYYKNGKNSGASASRNRALQEAKGKWIAFLDSDDLWMPDKLSKQLTFMKEKHICFSYTNYEEIDEQGHLRGVVVTGPSKITQRKMHHYCYPGCLTVMYDAENIGLVQIKEVKKNNDYAMWLQICKKSECWLDDECLAQYRRRTGSISSSSIRMLIGWHYKLWHSIEGKNVIQSYWYTAVNLIFGFFKKIVYVKRL